jgi:diguanylate cyclase (GGDEF)-like protein
MSGTSFGQIRLARSKLLAPMVVLILTISAIAGVWLLVGQVSSSREAQLRVSSQTLALADLQSAPFNADPAAGGSPTTSLTRIRADEGSISRALTAHAQAGVPTSLLSAGRADLGALAPLVRGVYRIAVEPGGLSGAGAVIPKLQGTLTRRSAALATVLARIGRADAGRATAAYTEATLGAAGAMLLLLAAFAYFYFRSVAAHQAVERLAADKEALLGVSRGEARTDALTGLGNRRALTSDLAAAMAEPPGAGKLLLVMFDLDGFKQYNDTFGHPAGDALLQRLGTRVAVAAAEHSGSAYRMGGDEFCVLAHSDPALAKQLINDTTSALQDDGETWHIGCSHGVAWMPSEAATESQALTLTDERMYANKASRASTRRQVTDALLQVRTEQSGSLDAHVQRVSKLAGRLAEALGQPDLETQRIRLAAKLHDIGKTAIPAAILDKRSPLNEQEREFMHHHPAIGARIVSAAPALANTAPLIHSSHERIDGRGYPDGLTGENIPLGSRIIAVCDAYEAMTSDRPYQPGISADAALEELNRHAGTQFDATIVKIFCDNNALHHSSPGEPDPDTITTSPPLRSAAHIALSRVPRGAMDHLHHAS